VRRVAGGFANVLEASGSGAALEAAFALAEPGAHILLIGDYEHAQAGAPWQLWLHRELEVTSSNASSGHGRRPCVWPASSPRSSIHW